MNSFITQGVKISHGLSTPKFKDINTIFSFLLLAVFILTILEVFVIISKDVSGEIENCARDDLLFNGKTYVKVNSEGGLILVIFKLPVLFHGGRGEEIEEGIRLHLFGNFLGGNSTFSLLPAESFHLDCSCSHILARLPIDRASCAADSPLEYDGPEIV